MTGRHLYLLVILHVIRMSLVFNCMSLLCHSLCSHIPFACHSCVIHMPFVCTLMSFVYSSYILVCHSDVILMYLYIICMSHLCTRISVVCHSYILVYHWYVTGTYLYVINISLLYGRMSLVCVFIMNHHYKQP